MKVSAWTIGVVVGEVLSLTRNAGDDESSKALVQGLIEDGDDFLRASLSNYGIDSLAWMALLTVLENKFDIIFSDESASSPEIYTVLGLASAVCERLET
ncbi:phosphopantetheine-binding protein [Streptomyces polyrhachis]|uniref:Phosphopantetheine-binding protein n=1 Tax=Streptomyces polyrhachis TaxID=1282885 RepID=A0ABW2GNT4_9ACTN